MRTFVLMSKLAPHGPSLIEVAAKIKEGASTGRQWVERVTESCPEVKFLAHYALLGAYDFMDIYEAPDTETAHKVSLISRSEGALTAESWGALPYEEFLKLLEKINP